MVRSKDEASSSRRSQRNFAVLVKWSLACRVWDIAFLGSVGKTLFLR